jgi:hypothetical protein
MNEAWTIFWFDGFKSLFIVACVAVVLHQLQSRALKKFMAHLQNHHRTMDRKLEELKRLNKW